jgi:sugar phosphate isomerase/epimerase
MTRLVAVLAFLVFAFGGLAQSKGGAIEDRAGLHWSHLSTATGDLPLPGPSTEQTGALVGDLDKSGVNGFVLSFRKTAPALVWYRPSGKSWDRYVIDPSSLTVEAGGAMYDIDGDGYPDLVFGADYQGDEVWWWENPAGKYDSNVPWKRHIIKKGGGHQHHDQVFADFKGLGKPQLAFWNHGVRKLLIAEIPAHPREAEQWDCKEVFSGKAGEGPGKYAEGVAAIDVDGDGHPDLLAGNYWFKYMGHDQFKPTKIAGFGGRIAAGQLIKGSKFPQIVINSGDGVGPLKWYECKGDPSNSADWVGHDLAGRDVIHGHSLQIADIDGDGNLDIFAAEMAKWTEKRSDPDNPNATAWIFFGDGKGGFRKTEFARGIGFHEARVADLNGDGRMDILDKPYNWQTPRVDVWLQNRKTTASVQKLMVMADEPKKIDVGLQLYSLRVQFPKDVPGTMKKIHDMGITDVEAADFYGLTAEKFRQELDKAGLHASGAHFQWIDFSNNIDGIIKDAKTIGAEYITLPWIPHVGRFTEENAHVAAAKFNEWGRKCKEAGLHFTYHAHGYEFTKSGDGTVFDLIAREADPQYANFELDIFWAYHGGADPVKLMQKYPDRFLQMHLKDMRKSVQVPKTTGQENVENDVAMGTGQLDLPAILKQAQAIGIKHYYIEDESSHSLDQIPASIKYVRSVGY